MALQSGHFEALSQPGYEAMLRRSCRSFALHIQQPADANFWSFQMERQTSSEGKASAQKSDPVGEAFPVPAVSVGTICLFAAPKMELNKFDIDTVVHDPL